MRLSLLSLSALAAAVCAKNIDTSGFHSLKFNITRGNTFADSSSEKYPQFIKREDPDGSVTMELDNQSTFYSVTLKIGSQNDEVIVLVDTGSSDLWVSSTDNPYCESNASSKKFKRLADESDAIDVLGKQNYRKILSDREQAEAYINSVNANSKYRRLDDSTAFAEIFGSSSSKDSDDSDSVVSKAQNKAVSGTSSASSSIATIDCTEYGTFDYESSTSFVSNDTEFYILYGDSTYALGNWGYDNIEIGNLTVANLSFAVANQSNSSMGVLGIGLEGLETTNTGALVDGNGYTYSNLPSKLVEDGLINKRAYSLWLNSWSDSTGNVLFGAVDHAKYEGTLSILPVLNTLASYGYSDPIKLQITLSGITLNSSDDNVAVTSTSYPALLDSGTTLTYLPDNMVSTIASSLGASYSYSYGYYLMDCPSTDTVNFTFSFQGIDIEVPLTNFVLSANTAGTTCVLALIGSDDIILGDSFLRSAYVVYDLENYQVALAQAIFTDDEDIEVITSTIPSATSATSYYYTYGASGVVTGSVSNGVTEDTATTSIVTNGTTSTRSRSSSTASSTSSSNSNRNSAGLSVSTPSFWTLATVVGLICGFSALAI